MSDEIENCKKQPINVAEDKTGRLQEEDSQDWGDMVERYIDLNKDLFAEEAFVAMFVAILREVSRLSPTGIAGVSELARFFAMLKGGAKISLESLCMAILERLRPPTDADDQALIRVATSGLVFLIEQGSKDGFAAGRQSQRHSDLVAAIEHFIQDRSARQKAAEKRWATITRKDPPRPPADTALKAEVRQRIRAKITKQKTKP